MAVLSLGVRSKDGVWVFGLVRRADDGADRVA